MEDVKARLEETVKRCIESYEEWTADPKKAGIRQQMEESVHELRKVTSRIEIEMAIVDRSNSSLKPMPIPPHRASQLKGGKRQNGHQQEKPAPKNEKKVASASVANGLKPTDKSGDNNADNAGDDGAKKPRRSKMKTISITSKSED